MLNIIIYTLCGLGIGFSLGMLAAAVLVDRRAKKRKRELAPFFVHLDSEPQFWEMQEGPDEPEDYMEQCYEYELKCKEEEENEERQKVC